MTLYEIDKAIYELLENGFAVDEETGEVIDGAEELDKLQFERSQKLESVALYIKSIEAFIADIKAEEEALANRRKKKEDKVERLKKYLTNSIIGSGEESFESAKVSVSFRKSEGVEFTDKDALEDDLENIFRLEGIEGIDVAMLIERNEEVGEPSTRLYIGSVK